MSYIVKTKISKYIKEPVLTCFLFGLIVGEYTLYSEFSGRNVHIAFENKSDADKFINTDAESKLNAIQDRHDTTPSQEAHAIHRYRNLEDVDWC